MTVIIRPFRSLLIENSTRKQEFSSVTSAQDDPDDGNKCTYPDVIIKDGYVAPDGNAIVFEIGSL